MPRPIGAPTAVPGRAGRLSDLVQVGFRVRQGFVIASDESVESFALAHAVDELGGFPVTVAGNSVRYSAEDTDALVRRIADCRADAAEVVVQLPLAADLVGTAESVDREGGDDDACQIEAVPGGEPTAPSHFRVRIRDGVVLERRLVDARTNISENLAKEITAGLVRLQFAALQPVGIEWASDDEGRLWVLDSHVCDPLQPPAGWVWSDPPLSASPEVLARLTAAFAEVPSELLAVPPQVRSCDGRVAWHRAAWEVPLPVESAFKRRMRLMSGRARVQAVRATLAKAEVGNIALEWADLAGAVLTLCRCEFAASERGPRALFEALAGESLLGGGGARAHGGGSGPRWFDRLGFGPPVDAEGDLLALVAGFGRVVRGS